MFLNTFALLKRDPISPPHSTKYNNVFRKVTLASFLIRSKISSREKKTNRNFSIVPLAVSVWVVRFVGSVFQGSRATFGLACAQQGLYHFTAGVPEDRQNRQSCKEDLSSTQRHLSTLLRSGVGNWSHVVPGQL